jgi:hypothetical protein
MPRVGAESVEYSEKAMKLIVNCYLCEASLLARGECMTLEDGQRVGPETLVTNYQSTLKNTPEERKFKLNCSCET